MFIENKKILTFTDDVNVLADAAGQIALIGRRRSGMKVQTIDGEPATQTPLGTLLKEAGFVLSHRGLTYSNA